MVDWVYEHPQIAVAIAALLFWWGRFLFGHKLNWLTCWNRVGSRERWWHDFDLHDWEVDTKSERASGMRCTRCLGRYIGNRNYRYGR